MPWASTTIWPNLGWAVACSVGGALVVVVAAVVGGAVPGVTDLKPLLPQAASTAAAADAPKTHITRARPMGPSLSPIGTAEAGARIVAEDGYEVLYRVTVVWRPLSSTME